jgi:hypothetical protein
MWIETAARRGDQIDRNRHRGVLLLELLDVALDAINQRLIGRAEVGTT